MSSRGATAAGTDGSDFAHRQKIASHYQISALNKSRFKYCLLLHILLFVMMCAKLSEDILDRFNIFILELEELYIPKPHLWEWIWTSSFIFIFAGLSAVKQNNVTTMKFYVITDFLLALCPILYAAVYYFNDLRAFIENRDTSKVSEVWRGYPVALIWYAFIVVAAQIHLFQLLFAFKLIFAWSVRKNVSKKSN